MVSRVSEWIGASVLALACAVGLLGCEKERWEVSGNVRAPDAAVAAALGDTSHQNVHEFAAADVPKIAYPRALRPCCAFGADLKVRAGLVPVPGVEIGNLVGLSDIGPHRYDNGYLSISGSDRRGIVARENNGLIYTCRGGFIDLAHVRDNADNTMGLTSAVGRMMDTGGSIDIPPQGAAMRVRLKPIPASAIQKYGRIPLAVEIAKWLAYQLSIWHEIATFYGYASVAGWPEKISAFSPEDLYSNEIGVRLAGAIILSKQARTDEEYDLGMDAWIRAMLERLGAVSLKDSYAAMRAVDGAWWDSTKRIPDWTLVMRRRFDTGPWLRPWRLEIASPGTKGAVEPLPDCAHAGPPLELQVPDGFRGAAFHDYATLEFELNDALVDAGFPLPRPPSRVVTQEDFPLIIETARAENAEAFGPGADAP